MCKMCKMSSKKLCFKCLKISQLDNWNKWIKTTKKISKTKKIKFTDEIIHEMTESNKKQQNLESKQVIDDVIENIISMIIKDQEINKQMKINFTRKTIYIPFMRKPLC